MSRGARNALIVTGTVIGVLLIGVAVWGMATGWGVYSNRFGLMRGFFGPAVVILPLIGILVWAFIIWGIFMLIRGTVRHAHTDYYDRGETALDILKKRYARGEITKEEFEDRKKDLL